MKRNIFQPIKIVDDFLEAPEIWRDYALKQEYIKDQSGYPGIKSKTLDELNVNSFHELAGKLILHMNEKKSFKRLKINFVSAIKEDEIKILNPHQDEHFYNVAGVIYLNQSSPENTGTSFYTETPNGLVKTITVENVFNRLVLFHPSVWHSPDKFFGNQINDSRLIITFFGVAV
jgi:hypothetical protein